jgi:hypothetical protein
MESLPAHGKTTDCRRAKTPHGGLNRAVRPVLSALIGALLVSIVVGQRSPMARALEAHA